MKKEVRLEIVITSPVASRLSFAMVFQMKLDIILTWLSCPRSSLTKRDDFLMGYCGGFWSLAAIFLQHVAKVS
jgi:hypothetical protein